MPRWKRRSCIIPGINLNQERIIVIQPESAALPNDLVKKPARGNPLSGFFTFVKNTYVIVELEVRKLRHDPSEIVMRSIQPALWLIIYGEVMTKTGAIATGSTPYIDFISPGILAQSSMFVAIFSGMAIIWERDLGIVHKFLVSPAARGSLALGKSLAGAVRAVSQAVVVYLIAVILGVHLNWNPLALLGVIVITILGAAAFSAFSLTIALIVKTRERFMGIGQVMTMPIFFASSAIYPISVMPTWLKVIAHGNPLTYQVDALRNLMLSPGIGIYSLWLDFGVMLAATTILVTISALLYPRVGT
jgi:ABC-2 type transport system permease protein